MFSGTATGINVKPFITGQCVPCADELQHKVTLAEVISHCASAPFELMHTDLGGKIYNPSLGGPNFKPTTCVKLWLTILCYLKHKSGATTRLSERVAMVEAQFVASIKAISPDSGGEFVRGIFPEPTTRISSHKHHVVEQKAFV